MSASDESALPLPLPDDPANEPAAGSAIGPSAPPSAGGPASVEDFSREAIGQESIGTAAQADAAALALDGVPPGALTAGVLAALEPWREELSGRGLLAVINAGERLSCWAQVGVVRSTARFAEPGVAVPVWQAVTALQTGAGGHTTLPGRPPGDDPCRAPAPGAGAAPDAGTEPCCADRPAPGNPERVACPGQSRIRDRTGELLADPVWRPAIAAETAGMAAAELAVALTLAPVTAAVRIGQAQTFIEDLPGTLAAWGAGTIDRSRACRIADATAVLQPAQRRQVEERVLPRAATLTPGRLGHLAEKTALSIDPEAASKRHRQRKADRGVSLRPLGDGMARLAADLTADKAALSYAIIDALAHTIDRRCDDRGIGAIRADTLADIIAAAQHGTPDTRGTPDTPGAGEATAANTSQGRGPVEQDTGPSGRRNDQTANTGGRNGGQASGHRGSGAGPSDQTATGANGRGSPETTRPSAARGAGRAVTPPVELQVVIAASTLGGLDDNPGLIHGLGFVPADIARALAESATRIRALIQSPAPAAGACGHPGCTGGETCGTRLDAGPAVYRPGAALRDHVITRDRTCRWPGCRRTAEACDLDHAVPFHQGGPTCPCNLQALCRRHHRLKSFTNWRPNRCGETIRWTSPHGLHATAPPDLLPRDPDEPIPTAVHSGNPSTHSRYPVAAVGDPPPF